MFDHTLAAIGTFIILLLLGAAYSAYRYIRECLVLARLEGEATGYHQGEKSGRAIGYEMGAAWARRRPGCDSYGRREEKKTGC